MQPASHQPEPHQPASHHPVSHEPAPVVVVGSASIDVSVNAPLLPQPGETVIGHGSVIAVGGKGANQAVAAVECGATTRMVGRVGADAFGRMVLDGLRDRGVGIDDFKVTPDAPTGLATISVEDSGMNAIVVVPGANARLLPSDLDDVAGLIGGAAMLVLQCEIPLETMYRAIEIAAAARVPVILNPAPYRGLDLTRIAGMVAYLVPNETEASQLWGRSVSSVSEAQNCARWIQAQGIECAVITLGAQGCVLADADSAAHHPGHRVDAIDTTGAGDAFVGCLAASLAGGRSRGESVRRALLYSALSTTRRGAQISYPAAADFERAWTESGGSHGA
jgi:ribokinase